MTDSHNPRAKEIFLAARAMEPEARADFLTDACGADHALRREVEKLLAHPATQAGRAKRAAVDREPSPHSRHGVVFTRIGGAAGGTAESSPVPADLLHRSVGRLRIVGALMLGALGVLWLLPVTLSGDLVQEFMDPWQWSPPVAVIVCSLGILWVTGSSLRRTRILRIGLIYQVVVAYGLAVSQMWGTFADVPAQAIHFDLVGFSAVAMWMVLYCVTVPTRPRVALFALVLSATASPVTYLINVGFDQAPALAAGPFFLTFVMPQLAAVGFAHVASSVIYGLGREVSAARQMGGYRLEQQLGEGGMGQVWRARHRLLARPAAIKLIRRDAIGDDPSSVEMAIKRFEREAQVTASLRSPHTVELFDFGVADDGSLYYAMELLEGIDLDALVTRFGPMPPGRAVHLARQACRSLAEAHGQGLIHQDIKPANLYVCRLGLEIDVLKVLDFGLVRPVQVTDATSAPTPAVVGTPAYMAPEIATGMSDVDGRADLYALGCVLFWMLTGTRVFDAGSVAGMLVAHRHEAAPAPSTRLAGIPTVLDDIVLKCLQKDRDERYRSATALGTALADIQPDLPWSPSDAEDWWRDRAPFD